MKRTSILLSILTLAFLVQGQALAETQRQFEMAQRWAPIIFQDTNGGVRADYITDIDFDNNQDLSDNYDRLDDKNADGTWKYDLYATVYYSVVETKTHYYLGYFFYHPRDYEGEGLSTTSSQLGSLEHEHDLEGITIVVRKPGLQKSDFRAMYTQAHGDTYYFLNDETYTLSSGHIDHGFGTTHLFDENFDAYFFQGNGDRERVVTFVESRGHGVGQFRRAMVEANSGIQFGDMILEFRGDDGVVYYPSGTNTAEQPTREDKAFNDPDCDYRLASLKNHFWPYRRSENNDENYIFEAFDDVTLNRNVTLQDLGYLLRDDNWNYPPPGANAPWYWKQHHTSSDDDRVVAGDPNARGDGFFDPAWFVSKHIQNYTDASLPGYFDYVSNDYLMDENTFRVLTPGSPNPNEPLEIRWTHNNSTNGTTLGSTINLYLEGLYEEIPLVEGTPIADGQWNTPISQNIPQGLYKVVAVVPTAAPADSGDEQLKFIFKSNFFYMRGIQNPTIAYIIDRSGSMVGTPLANAKLSANQGITTMRVGSEVSVVSFSTSGTTNYSLHTITNDAIRNAARSAVNNITTDGWTSIGAGLLEGCYQLQGSSFDRKDFVLLSDGEHNTPPSPAQALASPCFQNLVSTGSGSLFSGESTKPVHTIAFGAGADQNLLASIANQTGGIFLYVPTRNDPLALSDLFLTIQSEISGEQRTGEFEGAISAPEVASIPFAIGADMAEQTVSLIWDSTSDNLDLTLIDPNGTEVSPSNALAMGIDYVSGPAIEYFTIPSPEVGQWAARIAALSGSTNYALVLSGQSSIEMDADFDRSEYPRNAPITVYSYLREAGSPVIGATVTAGVVSPTLSMAILSSNMTNERRTGEDTEPIDIFRSDDGLTYTDNLGNVLYDTTDLPLFDDGAHGDGSANDGVYANQYTATQNLGTYSFRVHAEGTSPSGTTFVRDAILATVVTQTANAAPTADAGEDQTIECNQAAATSVTLDGSGSSDLDGDPLTYVWEENGVVLYGPSTEPGGTIELGLGSHAIQLTVDDGMGVPDTDEVVITIQDTTPPIITVSVAPDVLWPPNHKMVGIDYVVTVEDGCDDTPIWELESVVSNELDEGTGDGDFPMDIQGADLGTADSSIQLRAERSGEGNGRMYEATFLATDSSGNASRAAATVFVPHDKSDIGEILTNGGLPESEEITFLVTGSSLWKKKNPAELFLLEDSSGSEIRSFGPRSANICNTAGFVAPNSFYSKDVDGDQKLDALVTFDRQAVAELEAISTTEDGTPAMVLEVLPGHHIVLEMDDLQPTSMNLASMVDQLRHDEFTEETLTEGAEDAGTPRRAGLIGAAPNPFNPSTTISYYIPSAGHVELAVFDISGRLVGRLVDQAMEAGEHAVVWKGADSSGNRVASGVYFYRMVAGNIVDTKRMILLK